MRPRFSSPLVGPSRVFPTCPAVIGLGLILALSAVSNPLRAQHPDVAGMDVHHPDVAVDTRAWGANFKLAARWAPYVTREMTHSTSVSPRWIGETDRFWYEWENSDGTFYYLVDPARASKRQIFDNDRLAAELLDVLRGVV